MSSAALDARLPPQPDEWIDRSACVEFEFEGTRVQGYAGDCVSSALWAAGHRVLGRSFKYHRPRGLLSLANHDINVMVQDGLRHNVRADVETLRAGMRLTVPNTFGGLMTDRARVLDRLSAFLPVGFYYKAFYSKRWFPLWERMFRRLTGLGRIDFSTPRLRTPKRYGFCDVLVIGAGPSGLSAALAAADAGADVVLVDENPQPGGSGFYQIGASALRRQSVGALLERVRAHARIRVLSATVAAGYYADRWVPLIDAQRMTKMRARAVVVATGAVEQPAVFRNNDLPGVMLASAAQRLIHRYAVRPARRAVVLAANADGYRAALDLHQAGVEVVALLDLRAEGLPVALQTELAQAGIECLPASCVVTAHAGRLGVLSAVEVAPFEIGMHPAGVPTRRIECDGLFMSTGWAPAAQLLYQAGARMRFDDTVQQFVPEQLPEAVFACGRVSGVYGLDARLADGHRAGLQAAAYLGRCPEPETTRWRDADCPSHAWPIVAHPRGKNFVDFDEDLQLKDFENAAQEGFDNIELLKRFSTNGMGPSQGKHSNMNGLRILARITGRTPGEVGSTTARPFFHPVPMSHLAGRGFSPLRRTPLHGRHAALGAVWMMAGAWQRPEYYARPAVAREQCIRDEAMAVRAALGLIDVGTLGKIEVRGPQALEFLERVYTGRLSTLGLGGIRYAVCCDETGVLTDEGVVVRLAEDLYYFTTTTAGAATVYRELSRLNTLWRLEVGIVNLTGAMAAMNLAGPRAREVLATLTDADLSSQAFPYLAARQARVAGVPARLMRVGFVGEWSYEIHVASEYGPTVWDALMQQGQAHGIRPFGVEAQRLLRLEKGHLILGQDTDGLTTPFEANLSWAVAMKKPYFVGQRSLRVMAARAPRQKLVGFVLAPGYLGPVPRECHLIIEHGDIAGRVTSIAWSPHLHRHIGLAYVRPEMSEVGRLLRIRLDDAAWVDAWVSATPFYDPQDLRQKESA